jgi:hypothetical protein
MGDEPPLSLLISYKLNILSKYILICFSLLLKFSWLPYLQLRHWEHCLVTLTVFVILIWRPVLILPRTRHWRTEQRLYSKLLMSPITVYQCLWSFCTETFFLSDHAVTVTVDAALMKVENACCAFHWQRHEYWRWSVRNHHRLLWNLSIGRWFKCNL